jgi:hypothetical protein
VPCCDSATAQWLAGAVAQIDSGADGAQIVRAWAGWNDDQFGDRDDRLDRHGDRRGRIDHREAETLLAKDFEVGRKPRHRCLGEGRHVGLALVPPIGERPLRINVDEAHGTSPGQLRLHRQMPGQGRLARSALLRCHCQNAHSLPLAHMTTCSAVQLRAKLLKSG